MRGRRAGGAGRAGLSVVTSVPFPAALAWSSRPAAAEQERRGAGGAAAGDAEAEIIQLLKRAKVRGRSAPPGYGDPGGRSPGVSASGAGRGGAAGCEVASAGRSAHRLRGAGRASSS